MSRPVRGKAPGPEAGLHPLTAQRSRARCGDGGVLVDDAVYLQGSGHMHLVEGVEGALQHALAADPEGQDVDLGAGDLHRRAGLVVLAG